MPKPIVGPCGGPNQPPCPPVPATEPKKESGLRNEPPKGDEALKKYIDTDGHEGG
jgi:hypothetical protein